MQTDSEVEVIGGRYRLLQLLGEGGMGTVHTALDRLTGQTVALKRVLVPANQLQFNSRGSTDLYLSLAQEFRTMASLRHPNINSVRDYGFDKQRQPFFTMDLLKNAQSVFRAGWQSDIEKVNLLIQILQALAYLHRRGIIHRDLKPANILVVNGQAKVLDFGLSLTRGQTGDAEVIAGTLGYISPEILKGAAAGEASDLYAIGVIGYEMFSGHPIFESDETQALIRGTLYTIPATNTLPNQAVAVVLARLLSKTPADRYDGNAFAAIQALYQSIGQPMPPESLAIRESFLQTARFVGRKAEFTMLRDALQKAIEGNGSTWLIGGESGSGKTRLLDELRIQALVQGALVIRALNMAEGASVYQMWRLPLRWLCLTTPISNEQASILKALIPDIGDLLGTDVPDAPEVNALYAQERLINTILFLFSRQQRPILLIIEDLHWAGRESLDLLTRITAAEEALPLLVLGSFRDDESPDLPRSVPGAHLLKLARLTNENIAELSEAMLGEEGRQPQLVTLLQHETEGNPLFLVEVMRTLAEQAGRLDRVGEAALPGQVSAQGISEIMRRRLERLAPEDQPLLQVAALYGRRLNLDVLREFAVAGLDLESWLVACNNKAILEVQDNIWQFTHDKLRDVIVADLPSNVRPLLHRKIAEIMEATNSADYALLAYQWSMAGDTEREATYQALIGKLAVDSGAYEKAVASLERALALQAPTPESYKQWANLKRMAADAHLGLGERDAARRLYQETLNAYQSANYRWGIAAARNDLGYMAFLGGDFPRAEEHFCEALQTALGIRAWTVALDSVTGVAGLLVERAELEHAAELVSMILNHMSVDHETADRAARLLNRIKIDLPPERLQDAEERGKDARLAETAQKLLAQS